MPVACDVGLGRGSRVGRMGRVKQLIENVNKNKYKLYGQIPIQPKPYKNKQNQGKHNKIKQKLRKKTGPLKTVKPL